MLGSNCCKGRAKPLVEGQGSSPWIAGKRLLVYEAIKEHTSTNGDGTKYKEPHHYLSLE
jgi:hypothetical protein